MARKKAAKEPELQDEEEKPDVDGLSDADDWEEDPEAALEKRRRRKAEKEAVEEDEEDEEEDDFGYEDAGWDENAGASDVSEDEESEAEAPPPKRKARA